MIVEPTFFSLIQKTFDKLLYNYGFDFQVINDNLIILSNEKCLLELLNTTDGLEISFINPTNLNIKFEPRLVYESIYGELANSLNEPVFNGDNVKYFLDVYKTNSNFIISKFQNVLNGDFSWSEKYKTLKIEQEELILKILNLDYNNEIFKVFRKQDKEWKVKARNYFTTC